MLTLYEHNDLYALKLIMHEHNDLYALGNQCVVLCTLKQRQACLPAMSMGLHKILNSTFKVTTCGLWLTLMAVQVHYSPPGVPDGLACWGTPSEDITLNMLRSCPLLLTGGCSKACVPACKTVCPHMKQAACYCSSLKTC